MSILTESSIRNPIAIREALRHVCERGELLLLVTPYIRFESNFLRLEQDAVHVSALMSREDAMFGLRSPDLRIRFPFGHQFFEAPTRLLGIGLAGGRQSLSLSLPKVMNVDDYRASYRVERVGRLTATFSSRKFELLMANVVNISTSGVRIFSHREFEYNEVLVDDLIHIAISITPELNLNCKAKVRFVKDRILGLEFRPRPDGDLLDVFARWVFQKQEEEVVFQATRGEVEAREKAEPGVARPEAPGLVLVGGDGGLESRLRDLLKDLATLHRVPATTQAMKDLAAAGRTLALYHVVGMSMDERKRMKILLETLSGRVPFVLLATDVESGALFELGNEVKATSVYVLGATATSFFPRLLGGILRKHFS